MEKSRKTVDRVRYLIKCIITKARKSPKLVAKRITVTRNGKTYQTTVWVLPEEAYKEKPKAVQYDLFEEGSIATRSVEDVRKDLVDKLAPGANVSYTDQNGTRKQGKIISQTEDELVIKHEKGTDTIRKDKVSEILPEADPDRIDSLIRGVKPETRSAVTAELNGADISSFPKLPNPWEYQFEPQDTEIKGYKAKDYTSVEPLKISLVPGKDILNKPRPSWIPHLDDSKFAYYRYRVQAVKIAPDRYVVHTFENGEPKLVIANAEVLAAMQDYYLKRAKALKPKGKIRVLSNRRATYLELKMAREFGNVEGSNRFSLIWETLDDIHRKMSDMNIQLEEHESSFAKGRETAYGDKGAKNYLLDSHGVKVKRQNGDPITLQEVDDIRKALDKVYAVFGNRSSMARKFGLKISHSGKVLMHARNAYGIYMPAYKAIGVTKAHGEESFGFTLAHEFAHFIDNYLGRKNNRWFASDNWSSEAGKIAGLFRSSMEKKQNSDYQNRTCECFARALEQYFVTKTGNIDEFKRKSSAGNYANQKVFEEKIMPMIEKFLKDNNELLKSARAELRLLARV